MQKAALGKGLGALIPDLSVLDEKERKSLGIMDVELDKIVPNEYQPRKVFNDDKLKELAASIGERAFKVIAANSGATARTIDAINGLIIGK